MTDSKPNFLDPLNNATAILRGVEARIHGLGVAFEETGNTVMGRKLGKLSLDLLEGIRLLDVGSSAALDTLINGSEAASNNMIRAALAVAEMRTTS